MYNDTEELALALEAFLLSELRSADATGEYHQGAIRVIDARNHLFSMVDRPETDEEAGIYAVRDLCRIDEVTFDSVPDRQKLLAVARERLG